jgi:hypothetical protein
MLDQRPSDLADSAGRRIQGIGMEGVRSEVSAEEVERGAHRLARLKQCQISVRHAALRIHGLLVEVKEMELPGPAPGGCGLASQQLWLGVGVGL